MKYLDRTYPTPAEDLAADEALLEACEEDGVADGVLRFYQPESPCVVLGYGNRREREVDVPACSAAGIPVLRRVSGGGTVVLGPGCLAYTVVLPIDGTAELATVTGTNRWVMERQRRALEAVAGVPVSVRGHTDLAIGDLKFSGNAQRRRARMVLFHGTLLLSFDLTWIPRCLRMPSSEPEYREGRSHEAFVRNLGVPDAVVKAALRQAWAADAPWTRALDDRVASLMASRYGCPEWHAKF